EVDFNDFKTGDYNTFKQQYGEFKLEMDNFTTKVGELSDIDGTLIDSFSEVRQEVGLIESTVQDVIVDVNGLEDNMTAIQTTISQLPDEIDLSVKQGLENLEIGGANLNRDSNNFSPDVMETYDGSNLSLYEDNFTVEEWGATDAHRIRFSAGNQTSILKGLKNITSSTSTIEGEFYTVSFY